MREQLTPDWRCPAPGLYRITTTPEGCMIEPAAEDPAPPPATTTVIAAWNTTPNAETPMAEPLDLDALEARWRQVVNMPEPAHADDVERLVAEVRRLQAEGCPYCTLISELEAKVAALEAEIAALRAGRPIVHMGEMTPAQFAAIVRALEARAD